MLFKDSCNRKSNQQNLGTIKCSNLCTEIIEFTSPDETAVCNLASIALPRYVREKESASASGRPKLSGSLNALNRYCWLSVHCLQVEMQFPWPDESQESLTIAFLSCRVFDFNRLHDVVATATQNLNKIIDVNYYPAEAARRSNLRHRPIGLGVQVSRLKPSSGCTRCCCPGSI